MLIFNEKGYVEEIIREKRKPGRMSPRTLIRYLARYYYYECMDMSAKEYARYVLDAVKMFKLDPATYQEYQQASYTLSYCKNLLDGTFPHQLREIKNISITKAEMEMINYAVYRKERKVLFTLYVLATALSNGTGWVNATETDIFDYANVNVSHKEKMTIMHNLYKNKLIEVNHTIDKSGYKVNLIKDSEIAINLTELNNFGNQYLVFTGKGLKICKKCGKIFRVKNPNDHSSKYCPKCKKPKS